MERNNCNSIESDSGCMNNDCCYYEEMVTVVIVKQICQISKAWDLFM